jgi:molecular chaperone DnaJ
LGVKRGANKDEIKKAYFLKAKQYHPDISKEANAKEKFAEINNAYETLGDEQKKKLYDQTGFTDENGAGAGFDPFSGFGDFFRGGRSARSMEEEFFADFQDFFGDFGKQANRSQRGQDIYVSMEVDFMDAVKGSKK